MKKMMIMGGLTGFLIAVVLGLMKGVAWPTLFWRASVATLAAGLLLRWWARLWIQGLKESLAAPAPATPKLNK
jgi:ribose/xylose/arabinose/galactoside ABC-type transport system permease subunit